MDRPSLALEPRFGGAFGVKYRRIKCAITKSLTTSQRDMPIDLMTCRAATQIRMVSLRYALTVSMVGMSVRLSLAIAYLWVLICSNPTDGWSVSRNNGE
jgi:hypothetical protein